MYPLLFSPITINNLEIKNRIAYPSMGLLYSHDGAVNDRYRDYFREKARGGAGIVTVARFASTGWGAWASRFPLPKTGILNRFPACAGHKRGGRAGVDTAFPRGRIRGVVAHRGRAPYGALRGL
jgi:2,4-dienoyl-CoA reductase (NADPH2)